jgi:Methyltransferase domain
LAPPQLLYSLAEFRDLIRSCLETADVGSLVEIGSETGAATRELYAFLEGREGEMWTVEPVPTLELEELHRGEERFHLVRGYSPEALEAVGPADAWIIDGDHNYWTVSRELEFVDSSAHRAGRPALILLHDVAWPCARCDMYYAPERLPAEAVHPHSMELGRVPDSSEAVPGGFRGDGSFAVALHEGGPRNGVLTAVEDFLAEHEGLAFAHVPAVFGFGVIFDRSARYAEQLEELLAPYADNPLLAKLERNRLDLYLRVVELQDSLSELGLRQNRVLAEYDASLSAAETEAARLRLELAELREQRAHSPSS